MPCNYILYFRVRKLGIDTSRDLSIVLSF